MHALVFWGTIGLSLAVAVVVIAYWAHRTPPDLHNVDPLSLPANSFSDAPLVYLLMIFLIFGSGFMSWFEFVGMEDSFGGWLFISVGVAFFCCLLWVRNSYSALHGAPPSRGNMAHYEAWRRDGGQW